MASPNHGERHKPLNTFILHYAGMATGRAALECLGDLSTKVSCHYLIREHGAIDQLVCEERRAIAEPASEAHAFQRRQRHELGLYPCLRAMRPRIPFTRVFIGAFSV